VLALKKGGGGSQSPFPRGAVPLDRTKYQQYDADLTAVFALAALEAQRLADEYWPEGEKCPAKYESNEAPSGRDSVNHRKGGKKSGCGGGTAPNSERAQTHRVASQEDDACDEETMMSTTSRTALSTHRGASSGTISPPTFTTACTRSRCRWTIQSPK